ncbi:uncharacterized protein TNCV_30501 [Trichonephila clavipes]|nr:uncharacterized protein TNCV_30501 [Trichonephila clavipes]
MAALSVKRSTDILQRSTRVPLHSAKLEINKIFKKCFQDAATSVAKNKSWRRLTKPNCVSDSPRAAVVVEFRLLTGHDHLCAHLYRFNLTDFSFCVLLDKSWSFSSRSSMTCPEDLSRRVLCTSWDCIVKKDWRELVA